LHFEPAGFNPLRFVFDAVKTDVASGTGRPPILVGTPVPFAIIPSDNFGPGQDLQRNHRDFSQTLTPR